MKHTQVLSWVGVVLATALLATACSAGPDEDGAQTAPEPATAPQWQPGMLNIIDEGTPTPGGELVLGGLAEPRSFDPAVTITSGLTGGLEMGAIFDFLMRWDADTGELVPQLAESLESNADYTQWTLRLRPDVTFSDGTTLDAAAVLWSLNRYTAMPTDESRMWAAKVDDMSAIDERTIEFTLNDTWPTFGFMLTTAPGMVVAEASVGPTPEDFTPIGAGAYVLERHAPGEEIVLTARDDYWGGEVNIKTIRAVFLGDPVTTSESFDGGALQMMALNDAEVAARHIEDESQMFLNMVPLGRVAIINATEGRPGEDPRVRRAMALAVDPQVILERAYNGVGYASDQIFPELSSWHSGVPGPGFDAQEAARLVEEAKADGFDGKITYTFVATPAGREQSMAIKAQLDAVGFDTELNGLRTTADLISTVLIERNYDVSQSGLAWREAEPWARMSAVNHSAGNAFGQATSPEMDALIDEFSQESDHAAKVDIAGRIQEQWNEDLPALVFGPAFDYVIWSDEVRGIQSHINNMVLFDQAWIEN